LAASKLWIEDAPDTLDLAEQFAHVAAVAV